MKGIDIVGAAVVVGFCHTLLTATASFVEIWVGSAVAYACVFTVVRRGFGAVYHELDARRPIDRTGGGADVSAPDAGDA